jgi:hypothetical protein
MIFSWYVMFSCLYALCAASPDTPDICLDTPGLSSRFMFLWVNIMSYASQIILARTCSPRCRMYKELSCFLHNVPTLTSEKSIWNSNSWHTLRGSSLYAQVYIFMIRKWDTCGLSSITKKGEIETYLRPLVGFGARWQSTCIFNRVIKHVCRC